MYAKSFRDLVAYQKARAVSQRIFLISRGFPKDERFALTDQILRSSRSVGAQLAEAWAMRRYEKHFISKLSDADGEQTETQHWIDECVACGHLDAEAASEMNHELESIGRMLNQMILKAPLFCQEDPRSVQESAPTFGSLDEFFITGHRSPVTNHRSLNTCPVSSSTE